MTSATGTRSHREAADADSRFLDVDGVDLHHKVAGDGRPLVLLFHHFYGNVLTWRKVATLLAAETTVAAFDRPGFGLTERPPRGRWVGGNPYTRAWSGHAAIRLLDHLGADRAVLVGASAGGTVAIETALRHPDRVAGLVLVSPAITGDVGAPATLRGALNRPGLVPIAARLIERLAGDITQDRVARGWHDPGRAGADDAEAYARAFEVDGWARGLFEVMTAEPPPQLREALGDITVPTLVVTGDSDRTIAPAASRRTAAAIRGARFEVIPRCGHTPHEERPDLFVTIVRGFLAELGQELGT